jgi:hypothetical protein
MSMHIGPLARSDRTAAESQLVGWAKVVRQVSRNSEWNGPVALRPTGRPMEGPGSVNCGRCPCVACPAGTGFEPEVIVIQLGAVFPPVTRISFGLNWSIDV